MNCSCISAGYCPFFGKIQSQRHWQICRGEVLTPEACDSYRANWMSLAYLEGFDPLGCCHRGPIVAQRSQKVVKKGCSNCGTLGESIPVFTCNLHGRCTLNPWNIGQIEAVCSKCSDKKILQPAILARKRIEPAQLLKSEFQFNNSILRFNGKLVMAYRVHWDNARLAIAELDDNYNVICNSWLSLNLGMAQEDPRLFVFNGQLHVSYSAVYSMPGKFWTDVCYARLGQCQYGHWHVEDEYYPQYKGRAAWEKNWGFFEYEGRLMAVYSIKPHKILLIDGDKAELIAETHFEFPNKPGLFHGGSAPVFRRGEYYSFFHRRLGASSEKWYTLDLYTFEAKPPFRPSRHIERSLLMPNQQDRPGAKVPHAIFPGGAFVDEQHRWVVSFGYYDKWSEVAWFDINEIESYLVPLQGGPCDGVVYRQGTNDLAMWKEVHEWNEYQLPDQFSPDDVVVDIGAHIGSFTRACLDRGAGYVIACEPFPQSYELLRQNCAYYAQRCDIIQIAIGKSVDRMILRNPDTSGRSFVAVGTHQTGDALGEADVMPLSYVLPKGKVKILKLDCEGAEHDALAEADLSQVESIVGECHRLNGYDLDTFSRMLESKGYSVKSKKSGADAWVFWATRT